MPPQNSFKIKHNTPEADKLERRIHEQLRKLWDPAADATVAKYLTALVAKGYDRKKIHSQLKTILDESITLQLLDWLFKHLRVHGQDYQSTELPASSKPALKPPSSATQPVLSEEVELRLEDVEAQQLEGSDLEDDVEATDTIGVFARTAADARGPSDVVDAAHPYERDKERLSQDGANHRASQATHTFHSGGQNGTASQDIGKVERMERRHREPIPIPNFVEHSRVKGARSAGDGAPVEVPRGVHIGAAPQAYAGTEQSPQAREKKQQLQETFEESQQSQAAAGERRRLKSSVVLDWESWHKQRQPANEERVAKLSAQPEKSLGPERAPILPRAAQDGTDTAASLTPSQHEKEDARDKERDRERDDGSGRRKPSHDIDIERLASRNRDGNGGSSVGREQERVAEGGSRRRPVDPVHRSRSRSRSRSPRGRRPGRAPLVTANLLRNALREVDGLATGAGARGSKPSVFERLGANAPTADVATSRTLALQRVTDKSEPAADPSGSGRKRGADDEAAALAEPLGSPSKVARGVIVRRSSGATRALDGVEARVATTRKMSPSSGRQQLEHSLPPAGRAASDKRGLGAVALAGLLSGGLSCKELTATTTVVAEMSGDPKASELEALRQQLTAMQEKIARMEAAKEVSPPPQPQPQSQPMPQIQTQTQVQIQSQPPRQAPQPQQRSQPQAAPAQSQLQPSIAARLQAPRVPVPPAVGIAARSGSGMQAGAAGKDPGAGGAAVTIMPTSMSDVVIEGGSGSPPRRLTSQLPDMALRSEKPRPTPAQIEADLRTVVVENIHLLANGEVVKAHFSVAGPVKNVTIMDQKIPGRPTRLAIVEMATEQGTQAAAALTGSLLMDLPIVVTLKAVLMLQGMNMTAMGMNAVGMGTTALMSPVGAGPAHVVPGGRLNPAAAPFVPGLGPLALAGAGLGRGSGIALRPPSGVAGGWQPWPKLGTGARGRGSNVWVREGARPGNAVAPNAAERS